MKYLKYILIFILIILFVYLLLLLGSFSLSEKVIVKDLEYSSDYISIYNQNLSEIEANDIIKNNNDNIYNNFLLTEFNNYKMNNIKIPITSLVSLYIDEEGGDPNDLLKEELKTLKVENDFVILRDLENIDNIEYQGQNIKIVDVYNKLKYNELNENSSYSYIYQKYEVNRNKVKVYFKNGFEGDTKIILFEHGIFGRLKGVQVM